MNKEKMNPVKNNEDGILTKLFRKVVFETGFINNLSYFINRYIKGGGKKNKATISKIILDGEMTWKSFIFLIFEVLKAKKMSVKITVTHVNDMVTEHEVIVTPREEKDVDDDVKETINEDLKQNRGTDKRKKTKK